MQTKEREEVEGDSKQVADALVINFEIAKNVCGTWREDTHREREIEGEKGRDSQSDSRAEYLLYSSGTSEF